MRVAICIIVRYITVFSTLGQYLITVINQIKHRKGNGSALVWILVWLLGVLGIAWTGLNYAVPRFEGKLQSSIQDSLATFNTEPLAASTLGRDVTLTGQVGSEKEEKAIVAAVYAAPGVANVSSELTIIGATNAPVPVNEQTPSEPINSQNTQTPILLAQAPSLPKEETITPLPEPAEELEFPPEPSPESPTVDAVIAADVNNAVALDAKQAPSLSIKVIGNILSIEGTMSSTDDTSDLVKNALDSFNLNVVSNGLLLNSEVSKAEWLQPLQGILPLMDSTTNAQITISNQQLTIAGLAPNREIHDAIINKALSSIGDFSLIEKIDVQGEGENSTESTMVLVASADTDPLENSPGDTDTQAQQATKAAIKARADEQARLAAEAAAKAKADEQARLAAEAEAVAKREKRLAAEAAAKAKAEERARLAAEAKAAADEKARLAAIAAAKAEAEEKARIAAEAKAAEDARLAAIAAAKAEAEEKARIAAEAKAAEDARLAAIAAAKAEADEKARIAAEAKAAEDARLAAVAASKAEADEKARIAEEAKAAEDARLAAIAAAKAEADEKARLAAEATAKANEAAKQAALKAAKARAKERARLQAEAAAATAARTKELARLKAAATARAEEQARLEEENAADAKISQTAQPSGKVGLQQALQNLPSLRILFRTEGNRLTEESLDILDQIAETIIQYPETNVSIEGHTDATGEPEANLQLSLLRATTVRDYLIRQGVSVYNVKAIGLGEAVPLAPNNTPEGRAKNRRIEFTFR